MSVSVAVTLARLRGALRFAARRARSVERMLEIGESLGRLNWVNEDKLLSEDAMEVVLDARHGATLADQAPSSPNGTFEWLHVISEALPYGGHTRLLEVIATEQRRAGAHVCVAVTRDAVDTFRERIEAAGVTVFILSGTRAERAASVIALGRAAHRVVLHIHPDDLGGALAARRLRAEGCKVLFVNHADHCFSYGPGAADVCLEISGYGWQLTRLGRSVRAQSFLGIPVTSNAPTTAPRSGDASKKTVISVGSPWKYRPGHGFDFPAFATELLDRTDFEMEVIGPDPGDPWWASALARHPQRLRLMGLLPFAETEMRLAAATAYVDSFPTNGGTAFPQALMNGLPIFGLGVDHGGYGLADALRFPSVEAMTDALVEFLQTGAPPAEQDQIRQRITEEFSASTITARLDAAADGQLQSPPDELLAAPRALDPGLRGGRVLHRIELDFDQMHGLTFVDRMAMLYATYRRAPGAVACPLGLRARLAWLTNSA